jgi:hypothetical protein
MTNNEQQHCWLECYVSGTYMSAKQSDFAVCDSCKLESHHLESEIELERQGC